MRPSFRRVAAVPTNKDSQIGPPSELRSSIDDVIAVYKKDVDRGMLRENLKLTVTERLQRATQIMQQMAEIHESGRRHRGET
jgi:hypothetical protein